MQAAPERASRSCPRCARPLTVSLYEGVEIDECEGCKGAYLDAGELSKILKARDIPVPRHRQAPAAGVPVSERHSAVACPGCGSSMRPVNFNYSSGTILDRCGSCQGVWCDGAELEKAQSHYETHEDSARSRKPALVALLTDVENQVAANLDTLTRWNRKRRLALLLWVVTFGWAGGEATGGSWAMAVTLAVPAYVFGLWILRCPACTQMPVGTAWLRPWSLIVVDECCGCEVPLSR